MHGKSTEESWSRTNVSSVWSRSQAITNWLNTYASTRARSLTSVPTVKDGSNNYPMFNSTLAYIQASTCSLSAKIAKCFANLILAATHIPDQILPFEFSIYWISIPPSMNNLDDILSLGVLPVGIVGTCRYSIAFAPVLECLSWISQACHLPSDYQQEWMGFSTSVNVRYSAGNYFNLTLF